MPKHQLEDLFASAAKVSLLDRVKTFNKLLLTLKSRIRRRLADVDMLGVAVIRELWSR